MADRLSALLDRVSSAHGIEVAELIASRDLAERAIATFHTALVDAFGPDGLQGADVLIVGSIARRQCTRGSDLDYYTIAETELPAELADRVMAVMTETGRSLGFEPPNAIGPLACTVPRSQVEQVHAMDDFGRVMRRHTLLSASASVYRPAMRTELRRRVLSAYVGRDREPRVRGVVDQVVRLMRLGNMITELMLPMKTADGGLVVWTKSSTLYRVELAGCLAAAFRAEMACAGRSREELVDDLVARFDAMPIYRLLEMYDDVAPAGRDALATIVRVSNQALRMLGSAGVRERLAANDGSDETEQLRREIVALVEPFDAALRSLFFHDPLLRPWTERIGLFG